MKPEKTKVIATLAGIILCVAALYSCTQPAKTATKSEVQTDSVKNHIADAESAPMPTDTSVRKSANDIRFAGWRKEEWADNEYIRSVRKYLDAYQNGEITDQDLDACKELIKGKFVIADIQPHLIGGVLIYFSFFDNPERIFSSWVYSFVDMEKEVVTGYECRSVNLEDYQMDITQEELLQFLKECPEHKLW